MIQNKGIPHICLDGSSFLRRGNGFVRYSAADGSEVGVYTTLHPYQLSSVLRVVFQVTLPPNEDALSLDYVSAIVSEANANGSIGTFSIEKSNGQNTLRLLQLLWVEHRPSKQSLEELLLAGESALRDLYAKTMKGDRHQ